jgi:hypothetical protein
MSILCQDDPIISSCQCSCDIDISTNSCKKCQHKHPNFTPDSKEVKA